MCALTDLWQLETPLCSLISKDKQIDSCATETCYGFLTLFTPLIISATTTQIFFPLPSAIDVEDLRYNCRTHQAAEVKAAIFRWNSAFGIAQKVGNDKQLCVQFS